MTAAERTDAIAVAESWGDIVAQHAEILIWCDDRHVAEHLRAAEYCARAAAHLVIAVIDDEDQQ